LREIRSEAVQSENLFRRDTPYQLDKFGEIRMVAQRESSVRLVTESTIGIDRPACENRCANGSELLAQT
jgi:hypothetical protein